MKKIFMAVALLAATVSAGIAATPDEVKRETPKYESAEMIVEQIVAQYPDKVVFVDVWATWCGPCVGAMQTMKPLKPWMKENDIVTVYLTGASSPEEKWDSMIGDIGGEHYRVTAEEWKAICDAHSIKGIPSYMIYNKKGEKSFFHTGYPGNDTMQAEFEKVL